MAKKINFNPISGKFDYTEDISGKANVDQTMYIGTTGVAINRASAALTLAGITLTTPDIGTPSAGILTSCTGLPYSGLANGTDGELITWDAAGVIAKVAVGTAAQVLTSNGVGTAPTFQDAAGGGATTALDNLASVAMNASLQFDNTAARTFDIASTADTVVGRALTISAGSTVTAGTADMAGGNLTLNSGLGKGTGASSIIFQTGKTLATGSTLQTLTTAMTILGSGNVGIGIATPNNLLQVFDLIKFSNADSGTNLGYQAGKYDLGQCNTYVGYQAGAADNSTGKTINADRNTGIGYQALYANTTGTENSAIGYSALRSNTTGSSDMAMGGYALYSNTTGSFNTAMGYFALVSHDIGDRNSAVGYRALNSLAGAYHDNTALGWQAGRYQADGTALATPSQSVYIGSGARGFNNSDVNSIVIGYNAIGIGANSVVLGNDSITTTVLKGLLQKSVQAGITADTGSIQGGSPITANIVEISICANAGDAVTLPTAVAGLQITITNHGVAAADVFPASADAINEGAADAAKSLAVDASMMCMAYDAVNWECVTLAR